MDKQVVDYYLDRVCGFGWFNFIAVSVCFWSRMSATMFFISPIFTAIERPYRCAYMRSGNFSNVSAEHLSVDAVCNSGRCEKWIFDTRLFRSTIQSHFLLVCDRSALSTLVVMLTAIGSIVGGTLWTLICTSFGRVRVIRINLLVLIVLSLGCILARSFSVFLTLRFLSGVCLMMQYQIITHYVTEINPSQHRDSCVCTTFLGGTSALLMVTLVAYLVKDLRNSHRWLDMIVVAFLLISLLLQMILPESPIWLVLKKRPILVLNVLERIYTVNYPKDEASKRSVFIEERRCLVNQQSNNSDEDDDDTPPGTPDTIAVLGLDRHHTQTSLDESIYRAAVHLQSTLVRSSSILLLYVATSSLLFFCLTFSPASWFGDIYLNVALSAVLSLPAEISLPWITNKMGRRRMLFAFGLLSSVICTTSGTLGVLGFLRVKRVVDIMLKPMATVCYTGVFVKIAEVFPTTAEHSGIHLTVLTIYLMAATTPYILFRDRLNSTQIGLGVTLLLASLLAVFGLPSAQKFAEYEETLHQLEKSSILDEYADSIYPATDHDSSDDSSSDDEKVSEKEITIIVDDKHIDAIETPSPLVI